ncbi:MAG: hypothetical protein HXS46_04830 [Theionarchaea archaeon]|nr:hypothetical protein [Theionarchaea archaeon]
MSLEGVLLDCEGSIAYYKESIYILETGECHIIYKFFFDIEKPCDIQIFLPFKIEKLVWKQENIRNQEYVEKQAAAKGLQKLEKSLFSYDIKNVGELKAYIPENKEIEDITELKSFRSIHIKISELNLERQFFAESNCVLGLMFKVTTRHFLSKKTIEKLTQSTQYWKFNVFIYPLTTELWKEEKEKFPLIKHADIWIVLPENTNHRYIHPQIKDIMKIEKEDEQRAKQFTARGEPKLLKEGQTAIVWEFKDIKTEKSIFFTGENEKSLIDEIKSDLKREIKEDIEKSISEDMIKLVKETLSERAVTWKQMLIVFTVIFSIFGFLIGVLSK